MNVPDVLLLLYVLCFLNLLSHVPAQDHILNFQGLKKSQVHQSFWDTSKWRCQECFVCMYVDNPLLGHAIMIGRLAPPPSNWGHWGLNCAGWGPGLKYCTSSCCSISRPGQRPQPTDWTRHKGRDWLAWQTDQNRTNKLKGWYRMNDRKRQDWWQKLESW